MEIIKTYYVLRDKDGFKKGRVVKIEREKGRVYVSSGVLMLFHVAVRNNLVKLDAPKKRVKKKK